MHSLYAVWEGGGRWGALFQLSKGASKYCLTEIVETTCHCSEIPLSKFIYVRNNWWSTPKRLNLFFKLPKYLGSMNPSLSTFLKYVFAKYVFTLLNLTCSCSCTSKYVHVLIPPTAKVCARTYPSYSLNLIPNLSLLNLTYWQMEL